MNVVLVHGFLDTGRLFRTMAARLAAAGHRAWTPTLRPRDGRRGIPDLAGRLAAFLAAEVPADRPLALVGFSMGALVCRYYLGEPGRCPAIRAYFAIAAPFGGTPAAWLYPGQGTRQMRPGCAFLRALADRGGLEGLALGTFRTPLDLMVVPSRQSRLAGAADHVVWCPLHSLLPSDPTVIAAIAAELGRLDAAAVPAPSAPVV
jgi:triacylglycerol lipase